MRLWLAISLILLFLWLHKTQMSGDTLHGNACGAVSTSEAAVSLLLSPLSLYSWVVSTLLRFLLSIPALIFSSLYHSSLLLLAGPWCVATGCFSLLLTSLHVSLYLLHLVLVVGAVAILALVQHKMADGDTPTEKVLCHQKRLQGLQRRAKLIIGHRAARQGRVVL